MTMTTPTDACNKLTNLPDRFDCETDKILSLIENDPPHTEESLGFIKSLFLLKSLADAKAHRAYPSGFENYLKDKIIQSGGEQHTVTISQAFGWAYTDICNKSIRCSMFTLHNVLEEGARVSGRSTLPVQKAMVIMRDKDPFGANYHYTGAALLGANTGSWFSSLGVFGHQEIRRTSDNSSEGQFSADYEEFKIDWAGVALGKALHAYLN